MADNLGQAPLGTTLRWTVRIYKGGGVPFDTSSVAYTIYSNASPPTAMSNGTGTYTLVTSAVSGWYYASHSIASGDGYAANAPNEIRSNWDAPSGTTYNETQRFIVT